MYCTEQRIAVMLLQQTDGLVCQAAQTGWVSSCYYTGFHGCDGWNSTNKRCRHARIDSSQSILSDTNWRERMASGSAIHLVKMNQSSFRKPSSREACYSAKCLTKKSASDGFPHNPWRLLQNETNPDPRPHRQQCGKLGGPLLVTNKTLRVMFTTLRRER